MWELKVKGEAKTEYEHPDELNLVDCQDCFSDYFWGKALALHNKVKGGYLDFEYSDGKLWAITTYESTESLNEEEQKILVDYTQGQWSDGIGENFEQEPCAHKDGKDIYISPWFRGQICSFEQKEI